MKKANGYYTENDILSKLNSFTNIKKTMSKILAVPISDEFIENEQILSMAERRNLESLIMTKEKLHKTFDLE